MKTITTNNRTLLFVEVHKDADNFTIEENTLYYSDKIFKDEGGGWEILPEGNYRFIATTDTIPADLGTTDTLLAEHGITGRHAIIEVLN